MSTIVQKIYTIKRKYTYLLYAKKHITSFYGNVSYFLLLTLFTFLQPLD